MLTKEEKDAVATYTLDQRGILVVRLLPAPLHTLNAARNAVEIMTRMCDGQMRPVIVDMTEIRGIDTEARAYYSKGAKNFALCCALLIRSSMGKLIGNFVLSIDKPERPTRLFDDEKSAMAWLSAQTSALRLRASA